MSAERIGGRRNASLAYHTAYADLRTLASGVHVNEELFGA
jgi:hypothetical protein